MSAVGETAVGGERDDVGEGVAHSGCVAGDADIVALATNCRFANCAHSTEPGCEVREAVNPERLAHYQKLLREAAYQHERENPAAARAKKERWKKIHAAMKKHRNKRD